MYAWGELVFRAKPLDTITNIGQFGQYAEVHHKVNIHYVPVKFILDPRHSEDGYYFSHRILKAAYVK